MSSSAKSSVMNDFLQFYKKGLGLSNQMFQVNGLEKSMTKTGNEILFGRDPFSYSLVYGSLSALYNNLTDMVIKDLTERKEFLIRLQWDDGHFYEATIGYEEFGKAEARGMSTNKFLVEALSTFIDQFILGKKPGDTAVKKKRNTISKKQRDLKKQWLL